MVWYRCGVSTLMWVMTLGCVGGSEAPQALLDPDIGAVDAGEDVEASMGAAVGSACATDEACSGPGEPACLTEIKPLEGLVRASGNPEADAIWEEIGLEFEGGYCSTRGNCASDADCGEGGTCFQPLATVSDEVLDSLNSLGEGLPFDIYEFAEFGACLDACEGDSDCPREGYTCDVPLRDVLSLVNGAALNTFCISIGEEADYCENEPCVNGTCVNGADDFRCECAPGFEGRTCAEEIDACEPFPGTGITPCQNGGVCTDLSVGYRCDCPDDYGGDDCEILIEDCDPNPCLNGGTCSTPDGAYLCACLEGFSGNICQDAGG